MTRRRLFVAAFAPAAAPAKDDAGRVPTEDQALNSFAAQYNTYVEELRQGIVNVKQWARVVRAWRRLAGGDGA